MYLPAWTQQYKGGNSCEFSQYWLQTCAPKRNGDETIELNGWQHEERRKKRTVSDEDQPRAIGFWKRQEAFTKPLPKSCSGWLAITLIWPYLSLARSACKTNYPLLFFHHGSL